MEKVITKISTALILFASSASLTFAGKPPIIPEDTGDIKLKLPTIPEGAKVQGDVYLNGIYIPTITKIVIGLAGGAAVLFIVIGGIQILTAYNKEEQLGNAKKTIAFAIVGLLIAILSYAIVSIIGSININS